MGIVPSHLVMFDDLGEDGFVDFLNAILKEIFGPSLIPFGKGKEGGRDATFTGIPRKYEKVDEYWIFQYKFHELGRVGNADARSKVKGILTKEIEKVLGLREKPDCYILITNAELFSGNFPDWYKEEVEAKFGPKFKHLTVWDFQRLRNWLNDSDLSKIRETFLPRTIPSLEAVGAIIRRDLATESHPVDALRQLRDGIYSQNFNWFIETLNKFFDVVKDYTRRELAEILLLWLKKYPDRSRDILEVLEALLQPIDFKSLEYRPSCIEDNSLDVIADILSQLAGNFMESEDLKSIRNINDFIRTRFDLISDNVGYYFVSPRNVYLALKKLNPRMSEILSIIVPKISFQFSERYGKIYKGYELGGSGVSQAGNEFSLHDLAIIDDLLSSVLKANYDRNPTETWNEIKDGILSKKISKSNPTWLLRSTIPILLSRLVYKDTEEEAKNCLKNLILLTKSIPSFSDKIFHYIRGNMDNYPQNILLELIETDINKYGVPSNIFIVITLFELMKRKNKVASELFLKLLENEKYLKYDEFNYNTLDHFHIIADEPDLQIKILSKLLDSKIWRERADHFTIIANLPRSFECFAVQSAAISDGNLSFLDAFLGDKTDDLKIKVVFESLPELAKNYPIETFSFIKMHIENKERIEDFIKDNYTRMRIVEVGEVLAQKGMGEESLWIVDKFINDSDPIIDEKEEFDYHKQIEKGEDPNIITSVRGRIPWVLQKLAINKEFLKESFIRVRDLIKREDNLHIIKQSLIPLVEITIRKNWLKEIDKNLYFEFHDLLFDLLRRYSKYPALGRRIANAFLYYKGLDEDEAEEVLNCLGDVADSAPLFIYYAVYRKNHFRERGEFDTKQFEKLLKEKIQSGSEELRRQLAWHLWKSISDGNDFEILKEYIYSFVFSPYSRSTSDFLLMIIEEKIQENYLDCFNWFKTILQRTIEHASKLGMAEGLVCGGEYADIAQQIARIGTPEDYLEIVNKISELALIDKVIVYDLKEVFGAYSLIESNKRKKALSKLEPLWKELIRKNPRLAEIEWRN